MLNEEGRIGELKCSRDAPSFGCQIAQGEQNCHLLINVSIGSNPLIFMKSQLHNF